MAPVLSDPLPGVCFELLAVVVVAVVVVLVLLVLVCGVVMEAWCAPSTIYTSLPSMTSPFPGLARVCERISWYYVEMF